MGKGSQLRLPLRFAEQRTMAGEDENRPYLEKYGALVNEHMQFVDQFAQTITTGHLIVEHALDNILEVLSFYPKYVKAARLGFRQKVSLARSLAQRHADVSIWGVISAINSMRNEVAHNLPGESRTRQIEKFKRVYLAQASADLAEALKDAPDEAIAATACIECVGFLGTFEDDLRHLRRHIDAVDHVMQELGAAVPNATAAD